MRVFPTARVMVVALVRSGILKIEKRKCVRVLLYVLAELLHALRAPTRVRSQSHSEPRLESGVERNDTEMTPRL